MDKVLLISARGRAERADSGEAAKEPEIAGFQRGLERNSRQNGMHEKLMEEAVGVGNLEAALRRVESNGGAAGMDGMKTTQLREHLRQHWGVIRGKRMEGNYGPSPVRRVEIRKPNGGTRTLGIPTVQDRLIQQLLLQVLTPILDPGFSAHSYGFRPGRQAHEAVQAAQRYAREGKSWVVDMDISKFFDRVNHDIRMTRIGKVIRDKRVLKLIGRILRSGAMIEGMRVQSEEGTPQGGPLSPLLANIDLDDLDKELEKRGLAFCRYADDCNIYVGSQKAARRVLEKTTAWLRRHLRLEVNAEKSGIGRGWERRFLGFQLTKELTIGVALQSLKRFKNKVREKWRSCQSLTSEQLRANWRAYLQGWWNDFRLAEDRRPTFDLEPWIRRPMRKCFWLRWHNPKGRWNRFKRLGLKDRQCRVAYSSRGAWPLAAGWSLQTALSNTTLRRYGFLMPSDLAAQT